MTTTDPIPRRPEIGLTLEEFTTAVFAEAIIADEVLHNPLHSSHEPLPNWSQGSGLAPEFGASFAGARRLLRQVRYGNTYWEATSGLGITMDPEAFDGHNVPDDYAHATMLMLQLVALSRCQHDDLDKNGIPIVAAVSRIYGEMRAELGVAEEYDRLRSDGTVPRHLIPDFPGIDDNAVVAALYDGQLTLGTPAY